MRLIITTLVLSAVSALSIPFTWSITEPMILEIAMSGPGEPDLSYPRMIGKVGFIVAVTSFVFAVGFTVATIVKSPRGYRPLAYFLATILVAGIPCSVVMQGGPYNSAGDGGPNFFPLLVIVGGGLLASPFLLCFFCSLFFIKSKSSSIKTDEQDATSNGG
jgi:hypothetical protein